MRGTLEVVDIDEPFQSVLIINRPKIDTPTIVFPPVPSRISFADWLSDDQIILSYAASANAHLATYSITNDAFSDLHKAELDHLAELLLCSDRNKLVSLSRSGVNIIDLNEQCKMLRFDLIIWESDFQRARLAKTSEFFGWGAATPSGDRRVFHSPDLRTRYDELRLSQRLTFARLAAPGTYAGDKIVHTTSQLNWGEFLPCAAVPNGSRINLDIETGVIERTSRCVPTTTSWTRSRDPALITIVKDLGHERQAVTIELPDLSSSSCLQAIEEMTRRIEWQIDRLIIWGTLKFRFSTPTKVCSEELFYQNLMEIGCPAASSLRKLLLTFSEKIGTGDSRNPWCDGQKGVEALGYALNALALSEADSLDVIRRYVASRDGEHEMYCSQVVFPSYLRAHGWRDEKTISFGVYFVLNQLMGGRGLSKDPYELFTAAENLVTATRLADIVCEEAKAIYADDEWDEADGLITAFASLLRSENSFDQSTLAAIKRHLKKTDEA